jgi:hypothetical protein
LYETAEAITRSFLHTSIHHYGAEDFAQVLFTLYKKL